MNLSGANSRVANKFSIRSKTVFVCLPNSCLPVPHRIQSIEKILIYDKSVCAQRLLRKPDNEN